jgi:biofilm protein TabA
MIVDRTANYGLYPFGPGWTKAFDFLAGFRADQKDGEFTILGRDVFARIMTYTTRNREDAILESHRDYVDIQVVMNGREGLEWFPTDGLSVQSTHDAFKDATFYRHPDSCGARVVLSTGMFVALFPEDAHMPSLVLADDGPANVRKVVIKLGVSQLHLPTKGTP